MFKHPMWKLLSLYLVAAVFVLSLPAQGWAMLLPADRDAVRAADMAGIRTTLESSAIRQRLMDYGLTSEEAVQRIEQLSDEQVHQFAQQIDSVQAGGDGLVIALLIMVLIGLVVLLLAKTAHQTHRR